MKNIILEEICKAIIADNPRFDEKVIISETSNPYDVDDISCLREFIFTWFDMYNYLIITIGNKTYRCAFNQVKYDFEIDGKFISYYDYIDESEIFKTVFRLMLQKFESNLIQYHINFMMHDGIDPGEYYIEDIADEVLEIIKKLSNVEYVEKLIKTLYKTDADIANKFTEYLFNEIEDALDEYENEPEKIAVFLEVRKHLESVNQNTEMEL